MARTESIDRQALVDSILKNNGIISAVAKEFGVTAWAIYKYRDKYTSVEEAIKQARYNLDSTLLDGAELKLNEAIRNGDGACIYAGCFFGGFCLR
jgi:ACT domain-containing protein